MDHRGRRNRNRPTRGDRVPIAATPLPSEVADLRGQALLWAFILEEVAVQTRTQQRRYDERFSEVQRFWPGEQPPEGRFRLTHKLYVPQRNEEGKSIIMSLELSTGEWPNNFPYTVSFSLCRIGKVRIECYDFPQEITRPKTEVFKIRDVAHAQTQARAIVSDAIARLESIAKTPAPDEEVP